MESLLAVEKPQHILNETDVVLVAVAHPDDETVMHAEYIRRANLAGASVHIAYATVGEESTINARFWRPGFVHGGRRWAEALAAAKRLGVPRYNLHCLDIADGKAGQSTDALSERLGRIILNHKVTKVVTSGPQGYDGHPDHIAVDTAILQAVSKAKQEQESNISILRLNKTGE